MPTKKVQCSEEEQQALLSIVTHQEKVDQFIREKNIRTWKRAEEYWRLNQYIYWDEVALDYRDITHAPYDDEDQENEDIPPKTFGIYRAYGESVISAMTAAMPSVLFFPDDKQNPDDIITAKSYSNISEMIQKHSRAELLAIRTLATLYNQGLVASYVYWDEDEKYGTTSIPKYKNVKLKMRSLECPDCGANLGSTKIDSDEEDDNGVQDISNNESKDSEEEPTESGDDNEHPYLKNYKCDRCGYSGVPDLGDEFDELFPRLTGHSDIPKGKICIDIYGPLNVRVSSYARKQKEVGLLELQLEMDTDAAKDEFEDIADKISSSSDFYSYERWGRTSSELLSNTMFGQTTVRYCWLRPWTFWAVSSQDKNRTQALKKKFPKGCCVIFVNDVFAEAYEQCMDDCWTIGENPLDNWLHALPMGKSIIDCQDAFNESENLNLQKQAFGIKETFISTDLINEDAYKAQRAGAGYVTFVQGRPGEALSNQITQVKTAELDEEEIQFGEHFNNLAQFLGGAVPSIWGGNQQTGSKTATEYTQSRAYALQRLNINWKLFKYFWADTISKACRLQVEKMVEDEKYTRKNGNASETVWIKMSELKGKVGNIEPDVDEQFPVSWAQKRDLLMQLVTLQNPVIGQIMLHPNNSQLVKDALGLPEFYIPGSTDRTKQLIEIGELVQVDEQQFPPNSEHPTVLPDLDADDDEVHIQVCKYWLVSEEGLYYKMTNPAAYLNVVLHKRAHDLNQEQKTKGQVGKSQPGQPPKEGTV